MGRIMRNAAFVANDKQKDSDVIEYKGKKYDSLINF